MGRKSQALALAEEQKKNIARPERLFHEINLLHLEGHYFAFDPKVANVFLDPMKSVEKRLKNPKINEEKPIEIIPHPGFGRPSIFAYKVYQAILKKLSDYGHPVPETVSFGHREIMRLTGRASTGGKSSKELVRALNQLKVTLINCWFYDKHTKAGANLSLSFATRFLYTYQGRGTISRFTLWLDPWLIKSINNHYTFCLNFVRMENLEPISTALYKHIYFHFSNLYSKTHQKNIVFRKDYGEICRTWLGGLKILRYRSDILKDQLGRHLEALKKTRLIKSYEIEKNASNDGFNIILHPGPGFFEDYERFYSRRMQAELPFTFAVDENTIQKPQEIVLYFHQQLNGPDAITEFGFSEKETAFAAYLLEKHTIEETKAFIAYGIAEAKKTNFEIRSIGGLKKYYASYVKVLREKAKEKAKDTEERRTRENERRQSEYEAYRATEITRLRSSLPSDELERMENAVREELEAKHQGSKIFTGWIRQRTDHLLAEKHEILSFEEWQEKGEYKRGV